MYTKLNSSQKREKMQKMLQRVNIRHSLKTKVFSLSGGEKQRVAIARALLKNSDLILADEPTGSLDLENRNAVLNLLQQEVKAGKSVIVVSHDLYVREISDYVVEI